MARKPRIDLPGVAQHVIQRGNDRQPCFFRDIDRLRYLQDLRELALAHQCQVHAYVLMTNHVHLLVTPAASRAIGHVMQSLGRDATSAISMTATDAQARYGRDATNPIPWPAMSTSCGATAISSSTLSGRAWLPLPVNTRGAAMHVMRSADPILWSNLTRATWPWPAKTPGVKPSTGTWSRSSATKTPYASPTISITSTRWATTASGRPSKRSWAAA